MEPSLINVKIGVRHERRIHDYELIKQSCFVLLFWIESLRIILATPGSHLRLFYLSASSVFFTFLIFYL